MDITRLPLGRVLGAAFAIGLGGAFGLSVAGVIGWAAVVASGVAMLLGAGLVGYYWRRSAFGAANSVTLVRVVGTSWIAGFATQALLADLAPPGQVLMIVIGTSCLILDGVDGRLARTLGQASPFGARFDMETDAAMLMVLSLAVAPLEGAGWWVVAIGAMRYANGAASWLLPALRIPVLYSYARRVVAVIQAVALLACLALDLVPVVPRWIPVGLLSGALGALCWSFGRDIVWQFRQFDTERAVSPTREG